MEQRFTIDYVCYTLYKLIWLQCRTIFLFCWVSKIIEVQFFFFVVYLDIEYSLNIEYRIFFGYAQYMYLLFLIFHESLRI